MNEPVSDFRGSCRAETPGAVRGSVVYESIETEKALADARSPLSGPEVTVVPRPDLGERALEFVPNQGVTNHVIITSDKEGRFFAAFLYRGEGVTTEEGREQVQRLAAVIRD